MRCSSSSVRRLDRPVAIMAAVRKNTPSMNITAWLPRCLKAFCGSVTFKSGKSANANKPVTASGMLWVNHNDRHTTKTANARWADCGCRCAGEGITVGPNANQEAITNATSKRTVRVAIFKAYLEEPSC